MKNTIKNEKKFAYSSTTINNVDVKINEKAIFNIGINENIKEVVTFSNVIDYMKQLTSVETIINMAYKQINKIISIANICTIGG